MPPDLFQTLLNSLVNPNAPVPTWWPSGAWGAFLMFLWPFAGGVPVGVLMARDSGVGPPATAFLYFLSDVVLACFLEPVLWFVIRGGQRVSALSRVGAMCRRFADGTGLSSTGARGPLGLVLVAFAIDPMTGRAAGAAAGRGPLSGWAFAITGDMAYFVLLMASTLWLSSVLGNDRLTVVIVFGLSWLLPLLLRRSKPSLLRSRDASATSPQVGGSTTPRTGEPGVAGPSKVRVSPSGRRARPGVGREQRRHDVSPS